MFTVCANQRRLVSATYLVLHVFFAVLWVGEIVLTVQASVWVTRCYTICNLAVGHKNIVIGKFAMLPLVGEKMLLLRTYMDLLHFLHVITILYDSW